MISCFPGKARLIYPAMIAILRDFVDKGCATVEVNSPVHNGDGFEPLHAPLICFERQAAAFSGVGMSRPDC